MSRNRTRHGGQQAAKPPAVATVDLRAAARALLAGERSEVLALRHEALARIIAIARSTEPVMAVAPEPAALSARGGTVRAGVHVIRLQGIITPQGSWLALLFGDGPGGLQGFRRELREALGNDDVSAIVLDIHSPGGLIGLVPETAAELRAARDADKPIVAVANTMCASAAYWLAAQADEVVATPSGFAGSIGVYLIHEDWSGFNEAMGVLPSYIAAGRYKVEANSDEPLSDTARAALQQEVDDLYALFVDDVAAGRRTTAAAVRGGYGEGRMLTAERALQAGLIDRVATIDDVIRELATGRRTGATGATAGRAASDATRRIHANRDNPAPNDAEATASEEVRARIAELQELTPPAAL